MNDSRKYLPSSIIALYNDTSSSAILLWGKLSVSVVLSKVAEPFGAITRPLTLNFGLSVLGSVCGRLVFSDF